MVKKISKKTIFIGLGSVLLVLAFLLFFSSSIGLSVVGNYEQFKTINVEVADQIISNNENIVVNLDFEPSYAFERAGVEYTGIYGTKTLINGNMVDTHSSSVMITTGGDASTSFEVNSDSLNEGLNDLVIKIGVIKPQSRYTSYVSYDLPREYCHNGFCTTVCWGSLDGASDSYLDKLSTSAVNEILDKGTMSISPASSGRMYCNVMGEAMSLDNSYDIVDWEYEAEYVAHLYKIKTSNEDTTTFEDTYEDEQSQDLNINKKINYVLVSIFALSGIGLIGVGVFKKWKK